MTIDLQKLEDKERTFFEYLKYQYPHEGPNNEAASLFRSIQAVGISGVGGLNFAVPIGLLADLAACAWVSLEYNEDQNIPWEKGDHDYIILKTFRGFVAMISEAIASGKIEKREGKDKKYVMMGGFYLPLWAYDWLSP